MRNLENRTIKMQQDMNEQVKWSQASQHDGRERGKDGMPRPLLCAHGP